VTDARLRGEWLHSMKFDDLSDTAWRMFTRGLMWANENGTDGYIPTRYVRQLHPDGDQPSAQQELVAASVWTLDATGAHFKSWDSLLGQSTAAQVETYKNNAADRARKYRERQRQQSAKRVGFSESSDTITRDVPSDVTGDARAHVGIGEGEGQAKDNEAEKWFVDNDTGEITEPAPSVPAPAVTSWAVAPIPGRSCSVCGKSLAGYPESLQVCASQDDAHSKYRTQNGWAA
jgi:hypothetical protein